MVGRRKNRFIELCFMCQSDRVRYGFCHDCGHLSKYADQYRRYETPLERHLVEAAGAQLRKGGRRMTRLRLFIVGKARNGKVLCKRYSLDGDAPLWSFEIETLGM